MRTLYASTAKAGPSLEAGVGEGAVGLSHLVQVLAALDGCTYAVSCVDDLVCKTGWSHHPLGER